MPTVSTGLGTVRLLAVLNLVRRRPAELRRRGLPLRLLLGWGGLRRQLEGTLFLLHHVKLVIGQPSNNLHTWTGKAAN